MVDRFAATHPRFDELGGLIEVCLRAGFNLKNSYAFAVAFDTIGKRKLRNRK